MGISFLNPLFLLGLGIVAVPVIVHLVQSYRGERFRFPSLMFLESIRFHSIRRSKIRDVLLFLMRASAFVLLVLAFARPIVGRGGGEIVPVAGARDVVILLDGSYSMAYGDRWSRAVSEVRDVINRLGRGDRAALILFSEGAELVAPSTGDRNRLRAVLLRYYPAAAQVFSSLQTQIALHFVSTYPTPQAAADLSWAEFQAFAQQHGYRRPKRLPACFARLQADHPAASPETVLIYQDEAVQLAELLLAGIRAKKEAKRALRSLFQQHPDHTIFSSLPGAGELLAPALLAKFGDDRQRFPAPDGLQALAGTCPVTEKSGKRKRVKFRRACDRQFRHFAQQWAIASLSESVWAIAYWNAVRPRCDSDSHAYRCLANRWLAVAWKLWQSRTLYDEAYHLRQRAKHSRRH